MKRMFSLGRAVVVVLALVALATCVPPGSQSGTAPEGSLTVDQLLAGLDTLQGSAAKSLTASGMSVFRTQAGTPLSLSGLASYLNGIKQDFGNYVKSLGAPCIVVPVRLAGAAHYPSVDANGHALALSGLMWVPFTWGRHLDAPVITFQHGTQVFRANAPSRFDANPLAVFSNQDQTGALQNYVECVVGALMASAGYIVLMPDYPGFGDSSDPHPYVHSSLGNSVRDMIVAAKSLLGGGTVTPNGKVYLTGYSEGGYATMAGAMALRNASPPVTWASIAAVVPCDGPYDLSGVMLTQMLSGAQVKVPSYLLYTTFGYHSVDPADFGFDQLLVPPWNGLAANLFDGTHTDAQVGAAVPASTIPSSMLTAAAVASLSPGGAAYGVLQANDSYMGWNVTAPLVFVHCPIDDTVPYANAQVAAAALHAPIVNVQPVALIAAALGSTHAAAFPPAMLAAFTAIETVNRGY